MGWFGPEGLCGLIAINPKNNQILKEIKKLNL
jgi:hypothetical protein